MRLYRGQPTAAAREAAAARMSTWLRHALESPTQEPMVQASGRWFTDDLQIARWYAGDAVGDAEIVSVEVSEEVAEAFRVSGLRGRGTGILDPYAFSRDPEREFLLPRHIADRALPIRECALPLAA